ncbi:LysM peptidoglycan-binding domain-containing protein [Amycolatopsis balhimycina DSM 5908]|uniref:LysM peptidoglycan-binding domain-containing protein n=1 Tax=Amycolatopsis balhimycina DSM 5908 TaxID=1081091 RepID=A0A428WAA8_AMYBA|nr:LysM peptidoglycan-binding domain-containing protein [Amycolatopsis balhimycina]RSM40049.1 LysM peptidoglycan-binding domain-containing protein [Amycolatopsis balhimycina DSM 5908]
MSILAERGQARPAIPVPAPPRPVRVLRGRRGEVHRPPTRARVVAGRRPAGAPCAAPRRVPVRWPWLAALAVASCLVITGLGLLGGGSAGAPVPERTAAVSVGQGDTLASLAARFAPDSDPGAVVARIKELNRLDQTVLVPGLSLTVPVADPSAAPSP